MPLKSLVWSGAAPLLLASKSASRRALLAACGLAAETIAVAIDERALEDRYFAAGGAVKGLPSELARAKAVAASALKPEALLPRRGPDADRRNATAAQGSRSGRGGRSAGRSRRTDAYG